MFVEVIIDLNTSELDRVFDYEITIDGVTIGSRVIVPFGKFKTEGFVIAIKENTTFDKHKIKKIIRVVEEIPALTKENLQLSEFMRKKYHASRASILRLFLPSEMRQGKVRKKTVNFANLSDSMAFEEMISSLSKTAQSQKGF